MLASLAVCGSTLTKSLQTGAGTTMSRLGMPDLGVATLNDMRENAGMIASLDPTVPVIADADTGYGGWFSFRPIPGHTLETIVVH